MKTLPLVLAALAFSAAAVAAPKAAKAAAPNPADYPTVERVQFVQTCMQDHPGPYYEMLNKCSCAIDSIAHKVSLDDYVEMSTATNANSIGGERGNAIRDAPSLQKDIRKFRDVVSTAKKACFIEGDPVRR